MWRPKMTRPSWSGSYDRSVNALTVEGEFTLRFARGRSEPCPYRGGRSTPLKVNRLIGRGPAAVVLTAVVGIALTGSAQAHPSPAGDAAFYIVETISAPVTNYDGGVAGFAKTKPDNGE